MLSVRLIRWRSSGSFSTSRTKNVPLSTGGSILYQNNGRRWSSAGAILTHPLYDKPVELETPPKLVTKSLDWSDTGSLSLDGLTTKPLYAFCALDLMQIEKDRTRREPIPISAPSFLSAKLSFPVWRT